MRFIIINGVVGSIYVIRVDSHQYIQEKNKKGVTEGVSSLIIGENNLGSFDGGFVTFPVDYYWIRKNFWADFGVTVNIGDRR